MPGVLRVAFLGRGIENTRSEGEETLWGWPRISEEELFIVADRDEQNTCLRNLQRILLIFKRAWGLL